MAPKKKPSNDPLENRTSPLRWEDYTPKERSGIKREISRIGKQTKSGAVESVNNLRKASQKSNTEYAKNAAKKADRLEAASKEFKDKPITLEGAISRRQEAFGRAVSYARETGEPLPGAGWYFKHADEIKEAAGDIPFKNAAAASAALSPGKDPKKDEIPAFRALARLHNEKHSIQVDGETIEDARTLSPETLARYVTRASSGDKNISSSMENFADAGRAHEKSTVRAVNAIRGNIPAEIANNPFSAPKTSSYYASTVDAGNSSSDERLDYFSIANHVVKGDPNQGMFMFSKTSPGDFPKESPLSTEHDTAEDTWQHAITSGQKMRAVNKETGRTFSPAKRAVDKDSSGDMSQFKKTNAGLRSDTRYTPQGAVHAFNNMSTREAAKQYGSISYDQFGEEIYVPSMMMQEVPWTQDRREAGADAPFNKMQREADIAEKTRINEMKLEEKRRSAQQPKLPGF